MPALGNIISTIGKTVGNVVGGVAKAAGSLLSFDGQGIRNGIMQAITGQSAGDDGGDAGGNPLQPETASAATMVQRELAMIMRQHRNAVDSENRGFKQALNGLANRM